MRIARLGVKLNVPAALYTQEFDMADPKDLKEAADAIREVRALPAVQRHKELDDPLRQAEEWARKEYRKVRERNGDPDASVIGNNPHG